MRSRSSASPASPSSTCARRASGRSTASFPARCTRLTLSWRATSQLEGCCAVSRRASGSSSTALSASAPPWQCRPRRTRGLPRPATSTAASALGRRSAGRWSDRASASFPIAFGELRRIGVLAKTSHFAVLEREDVHPFARDRFAGLLELEAIAPKHEDLVVGRVEFARAEIGKILVLGDELEEFLHLRNALARAKRRKILRPANSLPVDILRHPGEEGCDVATAEGRVHALNVGDIGVAHLVLPMVAGTDTEGSPRSFRSRRGHAKVSVRWLRCRG